MCFKKCILLYNGDYEWLLHDSELCWLQLPTIKAILILARRQTMPIVRRSNLIPGLPDKKSLPNLSRIKNNFRSSRSDPFFLSFTFQKPPCGTRLESEKFTCLKVRNMGQRFFSKWNEKIIFSVWNYFHAQSHWNRVSRVPPREVEIPRKVYMLKS